MTETNRALVMLVVWTWVGVPFAFGVYGLIVRVVPLFTG